MFAIAISGRAGKSRVNQQPFKKRMREDELGLLLVLTAAIEDGLTCLPELVSLLKLSNAVHHQFVGFGHFRAIFSGDTEHILDRAAERFSQLCDSCPKEIDNMHEICDSKAISSESPIGLLIKKYLLELENCKIHALTSLFTAYKNWVAKNELNSLPLLLPPDNLFSEHNPNIILSPLPSYKEPVPIPTAADIESISKDTHQSLLYHALYHAKQRKTVLATEEMTQCCLKLTENEDSSCLARSSIALAQIFDLLGMKEESLLALNESINGAKGLDDNSVIAAAVGLKAQIDASSSAWRYAAAVPNAHPIAAVRVAFQKNNLSQAVLIDPFVAADVFSAYIPEISDLVPLSISTLPIRVLKLVEECQWQEAAQLIMQLDPAFLEVRATALAFAVTLFSFCGKPKIAEFYRQELDDVMSIDLGHFADVKAAINSIANCYQYRVTDVCSTLPLEKPLIYRLSWMCQTATDKESLQTAINMCAKYKARELYLGLLPLCQGLDIPECAELKEESLDIRTVIRNIAE